jgi:hypothetical protein
VESGRDSGEGWPESVNVPSKIGQVAAARIFAREKAVFVETVSATIFGVAQPKARQRTSAEFPRPHVAPPAAVRPPQMPIRHPRWRELW